MKLLPPPGPARRRQLTLLAAILLVLAVLVWRAWTPTVRLAPASNSETRAVAPTGALALPDAVKLDSLAKVPADTEVGRNPFGFGVTPPPPGPVRTYTPPPMPMATAPPVPQGPPPIALKLAGMTIVPGTGSARPMVTLRDSSGTVFQAFEGDVVDGRYRVIKIGVQSVVVSYVDGSGQRTIPLGG